MKRHGDWHEDKILELINNRVEESIQLEYKRSDSLQRNDKARKEMSKDVSAFANSIGGTIIYGLEESSRSPHYATRLSPVDPSGISKESVEQVINSRIHPRISGIVINPVELKSKAPGKFAYVVVVPESYTAHQASDWRYYKRFNFESVPMEDYEVRQIMNRTIRPAYQFQLQAERTSQSEPTKLRIRGIVQNVSEIVARDVSVILLVPRD